MSVLAPEPRRRMKGDFADLPFLPWPSGGGINTCSPIAARGVRDRETDVNRYANRAIHSVTSPIVLSRRSEYLER